LEIVKRERRILKRIEFDQWTVVSYLSWVLGFAINSLEVSRLLFALVGVATIRLDYHIEFRFSFRAGVRFFVNLDFSREVTV
jgi:hypothetical protein